MKKFILLFISILSISFFITTNKVHAQDYSETIIKMFFYDVEFVTDWSIDGIGSTYEYNVRYVVDNTLLSQLDTSKYYFITITHNIPFAHNDSDFNYNSYQITGTYTPPGFSDSFIYLTVFIDWQFVNTNYSKYPGGEGSITDFFRYNSALYITLLGDPGSSEYDSGFNDGYNEGYNTGKNDGYSSGYSNGYINGEQAGYSRGYDEGYNVGYEVGRDDGYDEGYNDGYEIGQNNGYNSGYNNGYINGEQAGYARGLDDGYHNGYNTGYQLGYDEAEGISYEIGYNDGYEIGYNNGYSNGINSHINKFLILIPSLFVLIVVITFVKPYLERSDEE